jgi:hypothetical protein
MEPDKKATEMKFIEVDSGDIQFEGESGNSKLPSPKTSTPPAPSPLPLLKTSK